MSFQSSQTPPPPPPPPHGPARQRAINLPRVTGILIAVNVAIFVLQSVIPVRWESWLIVHFGFIPARYSVADGLGLAALAGPFGHQFLHGGSLHLLLNMVMLAAFGAGVERLLGGGRLLALYLLSGLAGAAAHWWAYPLDTTPVVGASGAISGLFGAVLRLMGKHPQVSGGFLRILPVAVIWLGIAVMTGFTGMPGAEASRVAWAAHVGGFLFALILFDLFAWRAWPRRLR